MRPKRWPRTAPTISAPLLSVGAACALGADVVQFTPSRDATIYAPQGPLVANGSGQFIFAGRSFQGLHGLPRRALLHFDVSAIPPDAMILEASVTLTLVQLQGDPSVLSLHRLTGSWTAGPSDPSGNEGQGTPAFAGDCTWLFSTYDGAGSGTAWTTHGGDFDPALSAAAWTQRLGPVSWKGAELAADVQAWVSGRAATHGWILRGDESQPGTARRFDSADAEPGLGSPPVLSITWARPAPCPEDLDDSGAVDGADLGLCLGAWRTSDADLDGDGTTDGADLGLLLSAWGPCEARTLGVEEAPARCEGLRHAPCPSAQRSRRNYS